MTLGHVIPFRVYSRAFAPFFLYESYYIQHNRIFHATNIHAQFLVIFFIEFVYNLVILKLFKHYIQ
jgi:hypothetical protein